MLASSSGVSSERAAFMELVRNEIGRLNSQLVGKGGVSLVFTAGGLQVCVCVCVCVCVRARVRAAFGTCNRAYCEARYTCAHMYTWPNHDRGFKPPRPVLAAYACLPLAARMHD